MYLRRPFGKRAGFFKQDGAQVVDREGDREAAGVLQIVLKMIFFTSSSCERSLV